MILKTAGIKPFVGLNDSLISELKRDLLLFDIIGLPLMEKVMEEHLTHPPSCSVRHIVNELIYLKEHNLVFEASNTCAALKGGPDNAGADEFNGALRYINETEDTLDKLDGYARLCALTLNNEDVDRDFLSVPIVKKFNNPLTQSASKQDIIKIVLSHMPIPTTQVSWEAIQEFKSNEDNVGRLASIRNWINKTARADIMINEAEDELEDLLYRYQKSLQLHKIKYTTGFWESVVVGTSEFVEGIIKLQLSSVAKKMFSARQSKIELLQSELNTIGSELAYIDNSKRSFT